MQSHCRDKLETSACHVMPIRLVSGIVSCWAYGQNAPRRGYPVGLKRWMACQQFIIQAWVFMVPVFHITHYIESDRSYVEAEFSNRTLPHPESQPPNGDVTPACIAEGFTWLIYKKYVVAWQHFQAASGCTGNSQCWSRLPRHACRAVSAALLGHWVQSPSGRNIYTCPTIQAQGAP